MLVTLSGRYTTVPVTVGICLNAGIAPFKIHDFTSKSETAEYSTDMHSKYFLIESSSRINMRKGDNARKGDNFHPKGSI